MDALLVLLLGILIGILFTVLWYSMRTWWRKSKDLRSASAKAHKEMQEKSLKARQDMQKANDAVFRAGLRVLLLVVSIVIASWIIWYVVLS
jgi:H+/gluconate symporter-like permease